MGKMIDITGQRFGALVAIKPLPKDKKDYGKSTCVKWLCKCDCGNETIVNSSNLRKNHTKSCGCLQKKITSQQHFLNLAGQKFGKLTAIEIDYDRTAKEKGHTYWRCKCDCGGEISVIVSSLTRGATKSCGCLKASYGSYVIENLLKELNLTYKKEYCIKESNNIFFFDFYVDDTYIIEFDGQQHFQSTAGWNSSENVIKNHKKDLLKNNYCFSNNIPIIRIPYKIQDQIKKEDILLDFSEYILTQNNENDYYNKFYKGKEDIKCTTLLP